MARPARPIRLLRLAAALAGLAALLSPGGCSRSAGDAALSHAERDRRSALAERARVAFGRLPERVPGAGADAPELVALGKALFFDRRLSVNGSQSCNDCHRLDGANPSGADGERTSEGALGRRGRRNAPTVRNAALHLAQFWDGRAATLEEQAEGPILDPDEMAMPDAAAVARALEGDPATAAAFRAAFPGTERPVTLRNASRALAAFERTLLTRDRLDAFVGGDLAALSAEESEGLRLFLDAGCVTCHAGPALGARQYQPLGLAHAYPTADPGRFEVTHDEADRGKFKVAPLRDVARTAPYFHDGSIATLEEAVRKMAWHQLGRTLPPGDLRAIVAFLGALDDVGAPPAASAESAVPAGPAS